MADNRKYEVKLSATANLGAFNQMEDAFRKLQKTADDASNTRIRQYMNLNKIGSDSYGGFGGGGGGGGSRNLIGGFLKAEDKVSLGGGYKVAGGLGGPLAAIGASVAIISEFGTAMKQYKDAIFKGANATEALIVSMMDVAKRLPLIGGALDGLDNLAKELNGEAQKERRRASAAEREAASNRQYDRRKGYRDVMGETDSSRMSLYNESRLMAAGGVDQYQQMIVAAKIEEETRKSSVADRKKRLDSAVGISSSERIAAEQKLQDEISQIEWVSRNKVMDALKQRGEKESDDRLKAFQDEQDAELKIREETLKKQSEMDKNRVETEKMIRDTIQQNEQNKRGDISSLIGGQIAGYRSSGNNQLADRLSSFQGAASNAESLREIIRRNGVNSYIGAEAKRQLDNVVGNFQSSMNGTVSASDFVNASTANASTFAYGAGSAYASKESALLSQENPNQKTAENTKKMVELLQQIVNGNQDATRLFVN